MKKFKKLLAILLVASMIFTTNAVNVFAEGMNANQEEQLNEETVETSEETIVGAKPGEPEEEAEETTVGAKLGEPEEDIDENLSEPAIDEEEPEEEAEAETEEEAEETTIEVKLGELEIELELDKNKKDDQLYGDDPATPFAYWIVTGDGDDKTIHYYASATDGDGRTAVTIDIAGIEYTGLDNSEREEIKKAVIEEPIVATDVRRLFYLFKGLVSITDLGKLDTTSATSFESMFDSCSAIEELDVSGLETNSLTDTSYMFSQCSSLTKLTFGNYFDTGKVRRMDGMFADCTEITELDLTSFDTSSVTDMNDMFLGCTKLKKIYVSDDFTVENVDYGDDMFTDCTQLEGGSGTLYSNVSAPYDKRYAHIDGGTTNPGFFSSAPTPTTYTVTYNQNLPSGYTLSDGKTWYSVATTSDLSGDPIELEGSADMTCEDASGNVRTLEGWNTVAELTGDKYNFGDKFSDASVFTSNPLTLYAIWSDPVAPGPAGPYMYWIVDGNGDNKTIHYYASATDGDGRTAVDFDENGVVYTSLSEDERNSIKKAVFEQPIVATDVRRLFKDFKGLDSITDLGNLDTSNATSFKSMFEHCEAIKKIETSGLETDSLTDTSYMFTYCTSATEIILDDDFDTSNVTSMREMFNATGAVELDLTKFETSKVTNMYGMFAGCLSLKVIRVSDKFVVDQVSSSKFMFTNCENLVGEQGTKYTDTATPWDNKYAHIDEGTSNPGFFSGASTPTESKFCIKYFNITDTNWKSIASRSEVHNIINNPIVKEFTASTDTSEVAATIGTLGYTNGFKKLTKDEYDNYTGIGAATHTTDEEIYNIAKENGVFDQWKLSPTETVYYGINYYYYDAELNYAENHSSGTWEIYDNTFDWDTDLSPHKLVAFHNNDAEEAIVLPQVTVKGSDTYKMRNTSTGDIQYIWTWALQPDGMQERSFGDTENAWPFKPETKTLTLYAQWYGDTPTPPGPTISKITAVDGISLDKFDDLVYFEENKSLDITKATITVKYTDGSERDIKYTDDPDNFSVEPAVFKLGDSSVAIKYKTLSYTITDNMYVWQNSDGWNNDVYKIESVYGYRKVYAEGEKFDPTNLLVISQYAFRDPQGHSGPPISIYYLDSEKSHWKIEDKVLSLTDTSVKIQVGGYSGATFDVPIVVLPNDTPTAAVREKDPDKTQYVAVTDNHFDPTGLKIKLTYPGGITKIVEFTSETVGKFTFDPDVSADLEPSIKNIKVSFDGSPEVEFPITVRKEIKSISYVSGPDNYIYSVGDKFDPTGLVIKVIYVDDEEEEIPYNSTTASGFSFEPELGFMFEDYNIGQKVEVTFGQYMPLIPIDNTVILGEGFSFISADNITGDISLLPNITNRDDLDRMLDAVISEGAIGFHIISANGINDAKKKYNKYTASTLTKDAVLAEFDNYAGGFVFVGASFKSPTPTPKPPTPTPTYSNDSGSDSSSGGGGPAISGNNKINIFTVNNIPLSSMLYNPALYLQLMSYPENINMQKTNALDVYGHTGFGRWLRVPNTTTWYFYAGDFNNNTNNSGFLKDGWFNLGWDGVDRWYRFDSNGVMQLGWYEENGKIYFLQNDLNDNWYGKALTGTHVIDGVTYTFDSTGALIQ